MSKVSIIAAVDRRMAIGFQNKLLFWLPNDLKRFKALTTGNTIIMGRKTIQIRNTFQINQALHYINKHTNMYTSLSLIIHSS